jgi:hypothetical protein
MLVVHIRGRHDGAMSQPALTVHADVELHAEMVSRPGESHP